MKYCFKIEIEIMITLTTKLYNKMKLGFIFN